MKDIKHGLAWMGFWIGLGLYNFGGCSPWGHVAKDIEIRLRNE